MTRRVTKRAVLLVLPTAIAVAVLVSRTPAHAQALAQTITLSVPANIVVFVPCANGGAGELVQLSGDLHVLIHVTVNDTQTTFKQHAQPQGISGTGLSTGDTYHGTGVTQEITTFQSDAGPFVDTFVNNFRIIGEGPGNNSLVHENFHVTLNNNGDLTALHDNFSVECT